MGRSIYFTDAEIKAVRSTASEWAEMMGSGDTESEECVKDRMDHGLGSAMKKLHKGTNGEQVYLKY